MHKKTPTGSKGAAEPHWCRVMGLCEEVDSHRGGNHTQALLEECSGGVHGSSGVGGGAGPAGGRGGGRHLRMWWTLRRCWTLSRWLTSLSSFGSLPVLSFPLSTSFKW